MLMNEVQTWRELLGGIVADPSELQRIANDMDTTTRTLTDWAAGKKVPFRSNMYKMLNAIPPDYRPRMAKLLKKEFPDFEDVAPEQRRMEGIPSEIVELAMDTYCRYASDLRRGYIINFILDRAIEHIDPEQRYTHMRLGVCNPPSVHGKVRSIFLEDGRMAAQLREGLPRVLLVGMESVSGRAVTTLQTVHVPDMAREYKVSVEKHQMIGATKVSCLVHSRGTGVSLVCLP